MTAFLISLGRVTGVLAAMAGTVAAIIALAAASLTTGMAGVATAIGGWKLAAWCDRLRERRAEERRAQEVRAAMKFTGDRFVAPFRWARALLMLLVLIGVLAAGLVVMDDSVGYSVADIDEGQMLVGVAITAAAGWYAAGVIAALVLAARHWPALFLDRSGLVHFAAGRIGWADITSVRMGLSTTSSGEGSVGFVLEKAAFAAAGKRMSSIEASLLKHVVAYDEVAREVTVGCAALDAHPLAVLTAARELHSLSTGPTA